ncbi:MAG: acetoacetate decarboxylase family protein [Deltaproteobacteria bacterium]|nr:acetoacetate decarboxylase family protein [Deltaproteobacteria bacterium]
MKLPPGFRALTIAGRAVGFLALIEYVPPSPIVYAELAWMPCMVSARGARGYYIAKMYVDSRDSLEGGRELWAIPKQLAEFSIGEGAATVDTEDGAHLELALHRRGPALSLTAGASTLQSLGLEAVRFRGSGKAQTASGGLTVTAASGMDGWLGWPGARRLPALGAALTRFEITMHPPRRVRS